MPLACMHRYGVKWCTYDNHAKAEAQGEAEGLPGICEASPRSSTSYCPDAGSVPAMNSKLSKPTARGASAH